MMPKKSPEIKRSYMIGIKVDQTTKEKIEYLAGMKGDKTSTYIYNLIKTHIAEKEPWITKELDDIHKENLLPERAGRRRP